jgi:hypothetical protein
MKIHDLPTVKSREPHLPPRGGWRRAWPVFLTAISVALLAGCNSGSNTVRIIIIPTATPTQTVPTPTPTATPSSTPTATSTATATATPTPVPVANTAAVFAVDCTTQKGYVPLLFLGTDGDGEIAELDLSVDPDVTDPRVGTISTGIPDLPVSAAADPIHGEILVSSANQHKTGEMSVIQESDNSLVSNPFPAGSAPGTSDGVVYDPQQNLSVVSMSDAPLSCPSAGTCTGTALFDASSGEFTNFNRLTITTNFAIDFESQVALYNSILITPDLNALDIPNNLACEFSDENLIGLAAEPDGAATDSSTGIWVMGNFMSSLATVINLSEGTFSPQPDCMLNEGGTLPNSINFDTGTGVDMPGVAINSVTHQALLTADVAQQVALLSLPPEAVHQLSSSMVTGVQSSLPNDPSGNPWASAAFPYAVVPDGCHNLGYVLDQQRDYLAQIDLAQFQSNPAGIATALAAGHCAGTTTPFVCDNTKGVKFFPLPTVTVTK